MAALQCSEILVLFLILTATASVSVVHASGRVYLVGDDDGWNLFADSTNWTEGKVFHVGDTLVFNYDASLHNVMQVNSTAYRDCIKEPTLGLFDSGNDSIVLTEAGENWYICGIEDHCETGQKLSIKVTE